jgi:hypothetical protein
MGVASAPGFCPFRAEQNNPPAANAAKSHRIGQRPINARVTFSRIGGYCRRIISMGVAHRSGILPLQGGTKQPTRRECGKIE